MEEGIRTPAKISDKDYDAISDLLVKLFREIMDIEEKAIITEEFKDISNNDMHIIEAIGINRERSMSDVARDMDVTVGTMTIAINNLVKKAYVKRARSEKDRRVVLISLTPRGVKAYKHHKRFHDEMIQATLEGVGQDEADILVKALENLREFFINYGN